jgi:hypothetical protein
MRAVPRRRLTLHLARDRADSHRQGLEVTRAEPQILGQGLMELPYKTSAPVLNDLQAQLTAADQAAAKAAADAKAAAEKPANKPADPAPAAAEPPKQ